MWVNKSGTVNNSGTVDSTGTVSSTSVNNLSMARVLLRIRGTDAITEPEVARELRLSDTQALRIKDIQRLNSTSLRDRMRNLLRGHEQFQSLRESLHRIRKEAEHRLMSLLSDDQRKRLLMLRGSKG